MHDKIGKRYIELKKQGHVQKGCKPNKDGVANIKGYLSSNPKIMWILKESYDLFNSGNPQGGGGTFDNKMFEDYWSQMWQCMAQINYAIHNNFNCLKQIDLKTAKEELKQIAYINVGKLPAFKTSSDSKLKKCYNDWKLILKEQIKLYKPDVIIFGKTFIHFKEDPLFENVFKITEKPMYTKNGQWFAYTYKTNNMILIDAYHPARKGKKYIINVIKAYQKARA